MPGEMNIGVLHQMLWTGIPEDIELALAIIDAQGLIRQTSHQIYKMRWLQANKSEVPVYLLLRDFIEKHNLSAEYKEYINKYILNKRRCIYTKSCQ